jgi:hypothetical protein
VISASRPQKSKVPSAAPAARNKDIEIYLKGERKRGSKLDESQKERLGKFKQEKKAIIK